MLPYSVSIFILFFCANERVGSVAAITAINKMRFISVGSFSDCKYSVCGVVVVSS